MGTSEAVVSATSLDFFRGKHFVRIRAVSRSTVPADLESLGREISALLPGTGDPPRETETLRIPGHVDGSIIFHRRAILGYDVLAPGYEAKYAAPGVAGTLVLLSPGDTGPAPQFRERLSRFLPGFTRVEGDLFRADLPSGTLWMMSRAGFHFGVAGTFTRAQAREILSKMSKRFPPDPRPGEQSRGRQNLERFYPSRLLGVPQGIGDVVPPVRHPAVQVDEDVRGDAGHLVYFRDLAVLVEKDGVGYLPR